MHEHTPCQCDVCKVPHFERNNYFHGKTLSARDLSDEQGYLNEKRWLINRTVLGWGVVCGLDVCLENGCLMVRPGLALDCCGHELLVCAEQTIHAEKIAEALGRAICASRHWYGPELGVNTALAGPDASDFRDGER